MTDGEKQELFNRLKMDLWHGELGRMYLDDANASASAGNELMAKESLRRIQTALNPSFRLIRDQTDPTKRGWQFLSDADADYIFEALTLHFNKDVRLDKAFGLTRPGARFVQTDFEERSLAAAPYELIMVAKDAGRELKVDDAVVSAIEGFINETQKARAAFIGCNRIEQENLTRIYYKWRARLAEIEARVVASAWSLIDTSNPIAITNYLNRSET